MNKEKAEIDHKYGEQTGGGQRGEGGGMGEMDEGQREVRASRYGMNKSWGQKAQRREHRQRCKSIVW